MKKDIKKLNRQNINELSFSGFKNSNDPDNCLKTVVVSIAHLLQISLKLADIRNIRILDKKETNLGQDSRPPTFIATFYSASDCLKILDAKKS